MRYFERRRRAERDPERELGLVVVHQGADEIDAGLGEQCQAVEHFDRAAQVLPAALEVFLEAELGRSELAAGPRATWLWAARASASEALTSPRARLIVADCSAVIWPI